MIAASEPLEFVPHGRTVAESHPKKIYNTKSSRSTLSENSLLYKLTNFGIKDDSLLENPDVEEREWWCVREVYARKNEDFDDDTPSLKDAKEEFAESSESFRPTSQLKNEFNFSIKSEIMGAVKKMEMDCGNIAQGASRGGSANSSSNMSKKFNLNGAHNKSPTKPRPLDPKTDSCYEEELYVKGCTAVWSKGLISTPATRLSNPEPRETVACYTLENPIKHALFCNFHVSINNTMLIDALNTQIGDVKKNIKIEDTTEHLATKNMPSILLVDNKNISVYAADGREYVTSIPFQVKKVWPMKYGVLFEKDATPLIHNSLLPLSILRLNESPNSTFSKSKSQYFNMSAKLRQESISNYDQDVPLPTSFSMSHPLDEVTPLLIKSPSHGLQYYNDGDLQIIFVSSSPSIILIYDWKLGTHSLWMIRKALRDECLSMCPNMNSSTVFSQSVDFPGSPLNSNFKNATSWATGAGSPHLSRKGAGTPNKSRLNSPMANAFHQQGLSPHASIGQASSLSIMPTMNQAPPSLPLYPDICLDHIWTDSQNLRRDPAENASESKSFLHTDLVGHNYLCFMIKVGGVSKLQIVRLQTSHAHGTSSKKIIVGSVNSVAAKDAVVLEHLMMMALIDQAGNIILQSGTCVVGKVHVGGVLARLIDSPYTKRPTFQSPFPRRSSLLPSRSNDASVFDDSALHLLSPVPHSSTCRIEQKESLGLQALCDAVGSRLTLVFDNKTMYRITLPDVSCSAQIAKCCAALKAILPKDVTMQVLTKWYGSRNAPGSQDLTPEQEWSMFANLLFSLIGYDLEKLALPKRPEDSAETAEVASKKQRTSGDGTQDDWDYMLSSKLHKNYGNSLANLLNLAQTKSEAKPKSHVRKKSISEDKSAQFNTNALLFPYTAHVLYALHLVYEDTKLNTLLLNELPPLSKFLHQLAKDMRLEKYIIHYWLDFPIENNLEIEDHESQMTESHLKKLIQPPYVTADPPNFFAYINAMFKDVDVGYFPHLADVNNMSRDIIEVLSAVGCGRGGGVAPVGGPPCSTPRARAPSRDKYAHATALMANRGITHRDIEALPSAVRLQMLCIVSAVRACPPPGCYELAMRPELAPSEGDILFGLSSELKERETAYSLCRQPELDSLATKGDDKDAEIKTGMEHLDTKLLRLLYPRDHRMTEVCNLLQSSIPVSINLTQRPDVSDHDFIEEQEKYLFAVSSRTMALPIARGMLTLRTSQRVATESPSIPALCVSGRAGARRAAVELPGDPPAWPAFHSGAAAGLALPSGLGVPFTHNKQGNVEMSNEHAGFLLALGLNGQLKDMPFMNMYEYLVKCQEMISVGLLLGLAATYRGTMDVQATKMMSIHLEPLLPGTWVELDVQQHILVAALLGAGLLHQRSRHTHLAHKLLAEIGKPPGQDTENCLEREGYSLAAGLALGFVCVGAGSEVPGYIPHTLRTYMLGGDPPSIHGQPRDTQSRTEQTANVDVTSPGASLALGLLYMGSGHSAVGSWLAPPPTAYLLDSVRPDLLMLRCIARGLILWNEVEPEEDWVEAQVPDTIKPFCFVKPTEDNIDYEAMNQAYCNIVAGACFTFGLRFAGSGNEDAKDTLLYYTNVFLALYSNHLSDHNYFLQIVPEDSIEEATIVIEGDHTYHQSLGSNVPEPMQVITDNIAPPMVSEVIASSEMIQQKSYIKLAKKPRVKKVATKLNKISECKCFIKNIKMHAQNAIQNPFSERLAKAQSLSQDTSFLNNFKKMSKHAQSFFMMQLRSVNKKKKAVRFTDDEKLLALTLMKESPKGYRLLQKIFKLPTKRTLNRLAEQVTFGVGINDNLFRLMEQKCLKWDVKMKMCSIIFDEVALTPHLTYVESKDEIKGFKDLGDKKEYKFSDHALVFMLRGICCNWKQPIAYYFCEGTTSSADVMRILKVLVEKISHAGLIPLALVCDQGTTFRSAIKILRQKTEQNRNLNNEHNDGTIEISGQNLSVVYDPPHLLKGLRNNFLTKNLIFKGGLATWDDIVTVYNNDCQLGHTRMNKNLTEHHVMASKIKKMKVSVAAQALSEKTSALLKYTSLFGTTAGGDKVSKSMRTTGEAVEFIDQMFDSVNGSKSTSVKGKLRGPIKPNSDHFDFWREAIEILKNMKFVDSASRRALVNNKTYLVRVPSLDGWITTLESFERIAKLLFNNYQLQYFYPRSINQDPLENFFGRIRAINYRNVNPDAYTFTNSFKSLLISNVMGPHSIYSNCEEDDTETILDFFNLLKNEVDSDNQENVPVDINVSNTVSLSSDRVGPGLITSVINERVRVHSSAYTAGYLCRRITCKFNCQNGQKTYIANEKENFHEWIVHREYKKLKNSNLAYPSKDFLILYRDISEFIHNILNKCAHTKFVGTYIKNLILHQFNMKWLGCTAHKKLVANYYVKLILRVHIHNWCNIINKILRGDIEEKYVLKMNTPQIMAYNKYKAYRLRNKKK